MSYQPGMPLTQGPAYAPTMQAEYANWLYRVGSYLIDALITSAVPIVVRILIGAAGQTDSFGNPRGAGLVCAGGQCVCNATSGCSGCCSSATTCEPFVAQNPNSCGAAGNACQKCGANQTAGATHDLRYEAAEGGGKLFLRKYMAKSCTQSRERWATGLW